MDLDFIQYTNNNHFQKHPETIIVDLSNPIRRFFDTIHKEQTVLLTNPIARQLEHNELDTIIDEVIVSIFRYKDSFSNLIDLISKYKYSKNISDAKAKAILALGEDTSYILKELGAYKNDYFPYSFVRRIGVDSILLSLEHQF